MLLRTRIHLKKGLYGDSDESEILFTPWSDRNRRMDGIWSLLGQSGLRMDEAFRTLQIPGVGKWMII
jgi:hypothetical protein